MTIINTHPVAVYLILENDWDCWYRLPGGQTFPCSRVISLMITSR